MIIYIDADYRCYTSNPDEKYREFDVPFFDGKCTTFIEGYRYVPFNEYWINENGDKFDGCMISPVVDYTILAQAQKDYEYANRLVELEEKFTLLKEENDALKEENESLTDCLLEMSSVVYA